MRNRWLWVLLCACGLALLLMTGEPEDAQACGGFFCSQSQPVNQAAERIIFSDNPDGTVTAIVQILYQGPTEKFSWILPVPSIPTVGVSSNVAFTRLQSVTNPQYILNTTTEGTCKENTFNGSSSGATSGAQDAFSGGDSSGGGVVVVASGTVGPYDYEVIQINPALEDPAQAAVDWLTTNGYDLMEIGPDVLRPYFEEGMMLLAFRLTKQSTTGDIRPVILTFEDESPMIPIRPTAVAANDDMGVMTWVLGESRAIPTNYRALVLNDAVLDWLQGGSNYNDVVRLAADEAGGQGFVTEMADSTNLLQQAVFASMEESNWAALREADWTNRHLDLLNTVVQQMSTFSQATFSNVAWDGLADAVRDFVPLPEGVTAEQVVGCVPCYFTDEASLASLDTAAFLVAIEEQVVKPMRDTQAVINSRPYFTRFYTTLSAREMTVDPVFDFNPDLPNIANVHTADRVIECSPDYFVFEAPWRVSLPSGQTVRGQGNTWPVNGGSEMPFNTRVLRMGLTGEGEVVTDNSALIQSALNTINSNTPGNTSGGTSGGQMSGGGGGGDDCGCQSVRSPQTDQNRSAIWMLSALAVGGVVAARRRPRGDAKRL